MTRKEAIKYIKTYLLDEENNIEALETLIPELKKSEDEKMKEAIIATIHLYYGEPLEDEAKEMIAWLEKQSESDETKAKRYLMSKGYPIDTNGTFPTYEEVHNMIREGLEYQGKQKSADKAESKFKVGDWIVSSVLGTAHIIGVNDSNEYQLEYIDGKQKFSSIDYVNYEYDEWTIADAKDGDVLVFDDNIFVLFKDLYNATTFHSYCHVEDGVFNVSRDDEPDWWEGEGFKPATKEQRAYLFAKMFEAGYRWNNEKKELTKTDESNSQHNQLKDIWHSADEEPDKDKKVLVEWEWPYMNHTFQKLVISFFRGDFEGKTILRWAYLEDLIK